MVWMWHYIDCKKRDNQIFTFRFCLRSASSRLCLSSSSVGGAIFSLQRNIKMKTINNSNKRVNPKPSSILMPMSRRHCERWCSPHSEHGAAHREAAALLDAEGRTDAHPQDLLKKCGMMTPNNVVNEDDIGESVTPCLRVLGTSFPHFFHLVVKKWNHNLKVDIRRQQLIPLLLL